jgi:preprotein translocase subunit SecE
MKRLVNYLSDVKIELSKVVWPKRETVFKMTLTVIIVSAIVGAYLGFLDFAFTKMLEFIIIR